MIGVPLRPRQVFIALHQPYSSLDGAVHRRHDGVSQHGVTLHKGQVACTGKLPKRSVTHTPQEIPAPASNSKEVFLDAWGLDPSLGTNNTVDLTRSKLANLPVPLVDPWQDLGCPQSEVYTRFVVLGA